MNPWIRRLAPLAAIAVVAAGCSSSSGGDDDGDIRGDEVKVIGTWGGDEQEAFLAMVKPWEEETGATVKYTGTRDLNTVLTTGVASGVLPDLAGLPGPGACCLTASGERRGVRFRLELYRERMKGR